MKKQDLLDKREKTLKLKKHLYGVDVVEVCIKQFLQDISELDETVDVDKCIVEIQKYFLDEYDMPIKFDILKIIMSKHLKASSYIDKQVEISKKELKEHCIGDEYGVVYGAVCLLLLSKGIKMID